jgi:predicted transcriptional regulator
MTRPKSEQTGEFITLSIRIPKELHSDLQKIAISEQRSLNWVISRSLHQALEYLQKESQNAEGKQTTM